MSRATREQVYAALFAQLQGAYSWKTVTRRLQNIQDMAPEDFPAAFQIQEKQTAKYTGNTPTRAVLRANWLLYAQSSDISVAPSTALNAMTDAACAALAGVGVLKNTLGGLVEYAAVSGDIEIFEGVLGDRAIAIVPIEIVLAGF